MKTKNINIMATYALIGVLPDNSSVELIDNNPVVFAEYDGDDLPDLSCYKIIYEKGHKRVERNLLCPDFRKFNEMKENGEEVYEDFITWLNTFKKDIHKKIKDFENEKH